jgi:hypothetical protein
LIEVSASGYVTQSIEEVVGLSGNSGHRFNVIANAWSFIFFDTFGFGLGLDWDRTDDFAIYLEQAFAAGPTFDSSYANVIILLGLPGIALYFWLFLQIAGLTGSSATANDEQIERVFAMFLQPFIVYSVIVGFGADIVIVSPATVPFLLVIVMAVRLQELRSNKGFLT